ncbi:hypothetical protein [Tumebacillus permanentifrigoris]|uniref:Uncharacterized protein n=1 Tax=Tumebacillus permanentifrigoris TaxID=378543 RepID=A0A316D6U5_9BACL|nr:hypothetical protein [Tumebacillus permanentifrigoris]PWK11332.1 hypothetical protein C7459_111128 [Tumebacillus permanentifrigoris]
MQNNMTVLELDDFYYTRHSNGANLLELRDIRTQQEAKIRELPLEERQRLTKRIRERYIDQMLSSSARSMLQSKKHI